MFLVSLLVANPGKSVLRINFRCYVNWSSVRGSALSLKMDFLFAQFPCKWLMMNDEALRFATDPNLGGTEKLTIAKPCSGMMGDVPKIKVTDVVSDPAFRHVIPPLSIAFVKGWTRGMAAIAIMACAYEDKAFLEARTCLATALWLFPFFTIFFVGFGSLYQSVWTSKLLDAQWLDDDEKAPRICQVIWLDPCSCQASGCQQQACNCNPCSWKQRPDGANHFKWTQKWIQLPGMTQQSAAVRRKPNAFNLVYQLRLVNDADTFEKATCHHYWLVILVGDNEWVIPKCSLFSGLARCQQIPTGIWRGSRRGQGSLQPFERSWSIDYRKALSACRVPCFEFRSFSIKNYQELMWF